MRSISLVHSEIYNVARQVKELGKEKTANDIVRGAATFYLKNDHTMLDRCLENAERILDEARGSVERRSV
jgi:hypothetical protein